MDSFFAFFFDLRLFFVVSKWNDSLNFVMQIWIFFLLNEFSNHDFNNIFEFTLSQVIEVGEHQTKCILVMSKIFEIQSNQHLVGEIYYYCLSRMHHKMNQWFQIQSVISRKLKSIDFFSDNTFNSRF